MKSLAVMALVLVLLAALILACNGVEETIPTPTPTISHHTFRGEGSSMTGPFRLGIGVAYVAYRHEGEYFFSVRLIEFTGQADILITADLGKADRTTSVVIPFSGIYRFDVEAEEGSHWVVGIRQ